MAKIRKPRVHRGPADHYAAPGEVIVEYSYPDGTSKTPGGLISFRWIDPEAASGEPRLVVTLYRHDDKVNIVACPADR